MRNPFHKKTHELNERERLEQKARKAMNLEQQVTALKNELRYTQDNLKRTISKADAYEWLREQELMLMTSDGVKYLKGGDLDSYVAEQTRPVNLQEAMLNRLAKQLSEAIQNDTLDSFTYTTQGRMIYGNDAGKEG